MPTTLVAYIPVIHQGYLRWLRQYPAAELLVLGRTVTQAFRPLQKDIRALEPSEIVASLLALQVVKTARVVEAGELATLADQASQAATELGSVVMPREVVSQAVAAQYFAFIDVQFADVFLRWDSEKALAPQAVTADQQLDANSSQQFFMQSARTAAERSADWWRHVGAVVVKHGQIVLTAYNHHLPTEQQPYIDGDPRADFHKGDHIELSTAIHAEAAIVAEAARQGVALAGTTLYVTTFPCSNCARLIAQAGCAEVVFSEGYAMLDGEQVFKAAGVTITQLCKSS